MKVPGDSQRTHQLCAKPRRMTERADAKDQSSKQTNDRGTRYSCVVARALGCVLGRAFPHEGGGGRDLNEHQNRRTVLLQVGLLQVA